MSDPMSDVQKCIFDRLVADAGVHALVADRIYDNPPDGVTYPFLSFGPSSLTTDDVDCIDGHVEVIQIDAWVRANGRLGPVKPVAMAVKRALHRFAGSLATHALVEMEVDLVRAMMDTDGLTAHGVVQVRCIVEDRG